MSYLISDLHHNLLLKLNTDSTNTLSLKTYVNGSTTAHSPTYTKDSTLSTDNVTVFKIPHSDYSLNDTITKFELVSANNTPLYQTNEGVIVLLDGEEIDTGKVTTSGGTDTLVKDDNGAMVTEEQLSNNKFYLQFGESGEHDIQAVYRGNDSIAMAMTDKVHFKVSQPPLNEEGSLANDGKYVLSFVEANTPTLRYGKGATVSFRLTKGGVPVPNRTIQRQFPNGSVGTATTDDKGIVSMDIPSNLDAGKYKIGAFFYDSSTGKLVTSTYRDIVVEKVTPTLTDNFNDTGVFVKGSTYKAVLKYNGKPLQNTKVQLQVNKDKITKTTSSYGVITYGFKSKGTYNIKVVYKGNTNINAVELSRTITIP